jgi:hypothetical protein
MTKHLPDYDGRTPDGYRLTFKGAADNLTDALELDGEVVLIVRGKVKDPSFKRQQDEQAGQESFDDDLDAAMETEGADG